MPEHLELRVAAGSPTALADASHQMRECLVRHGVGERALYAADLALEEFGTNILRYAFADRVSAAFELRVILEPDRVELVFEDNGTPFDPTKAATPPRPQSLEEARVGGLGIQMIRHAVDLMQYRRTLTGNHLRVRIARGPGRSSA